MLIRKVILTCWVLILSATVTMAAEVHHCTVCELLLSEGTPVFLLRADGSLLAHYIETGAIRTDQTRLQKEPDPTGKIPVGTYVLLCDNCNKIKATCTLCGLPVREGSIETGDGRKICRREAGEAIMDVETARQVFETATREARNVAGIDFGLKNPNVTVQIFDINDWASTKENGAEVLHKIGHSKSRLTDTHLAHYVGLYSGQRKSEVICTCVHEYMHLWLNENLGQRVLEQNTGEAICELLAYKVAVARQDTYQQKKILDNPYTKGRINQLIAIERAHSFYYILDWVRNGTTRNFDETTPVVPVKRTNPPPVAVSPLQAPTVSIDTKPETLKLKGMFSRRGKKIALLNGGNTVSKGETVTIPLPGGPVKVKCLDVLDAAIIVQLDGATNSVTLEMDN